MEGEVQLDDLHLGHRMEQELLSASSSKTEVVTAGSGPLVVGLIQPARKNEGSLEEAVVAVRMLSSQ